MAFQFLRRWHRDVVTTLMVVIGGAWLLCQILLPVGARPPVLDQAFMTVLGAWVTSLAAEQRTKENRTNRRVERVEQLSAEAHPDLAEKIGIDTPPTHHERQHRPGEGGHDDDRPNP